MKATTVVWMTFLVCCCVNGALNAWSDQYTAFHPDPCHQVSFPDQIISIGHAVFGYPNPAYWVARTLLFKMPTKTIPMPDIICD